MATERLLQQQNDLQIELETVVLDLQLDGLLGDVGNPMRVGSAALGLMVRRDLDMTVVCASLDTTMLESVTQIGATLGRHPRVRQVEFRNDAGRWNTNTDPPYPDGLYLGVGYRSKHGHDWNVDVWFVDDPERQPDIAHVKSMPQRLTDDARAAILGIKESLKGDPAYGKSICGYDVYRSVLENGVRTLEEFTRLNRLDGLAQPQGPSPKP